MVPAVASSNRTVPVPASHATSVDAFVQVSEIVHVSLPKSIAEAALEMLTKPTTVTLPEVEVKSPPDIVRVPVISRVCVPLAKVPLEIIIFPRTSMLEAAVAVPPEIVKLLKSSSVDNNVMVAEASKSTVPLP